MSFADLSCFQAAQSTIKTPSNAVIVEDGGQPIITEQAIIVKKPGRLTGNEETDAHTITPELLSKIIDTPLRK